MSNYSRMAAVEVSTVGRASYEMQETGRFASTERLIPLVAAPNTNKEASAIDLESAGITKEDIKPLVPPGLKPRILIVGQTDVGKSTMCQHVFNLTPEQVEPSITVKPLSNC